MSELKVVSSDRNISMRSLLTFLVVGGLATVLQYGVMALLIWLFQCPLMLASGIGFVIGAVANYFLNARLTFRSNERHRSTAPRFAATATAGLAINSLLLTFFAWFGLHPALAQLLTTLGVLIWNYSINALWTFKKVMRERGLPY
jgi:putative flippase GtrA